MAQFTSSETADPSGSKVNAVLNTETNTITYTVTTASGLIATTNAPASTPGNSVTILNAIRQQITAQTGSGIATATALAGFGDALNTVQVETTNQSTAAPPGVQETNPIPTNNTVDPGVPPDAPPPDDPPVVINSQKPGEDQLAITAANAPLTINLQKPGEDQLATTAANAPLITEPVSISTFQDPQQAAAAAALEIPAANPQGQDPAQMAGQGLTAAKLNTASQATQQDVVNFQAKPDWRVRLSLSPGAQAAQYLYWANPPGILAPLQATDGVIFPYTPDISVSYNAAYDPTELTHSNYKYFTYKGSSVDQISIGCTFTAQDTAEAQYVLAVIHFFRSVTKMFYGQDQNPKNGTPPPLCYLSGLGAFQFDAHPLVITNFTYKLPTDVDYIQAGSSSTPAGVNRQNSPIQPKSFGSDPAQAGEARRSSSGLNPGGLTAAPNWQTTNTGTKEATWVPTKINISITANPIITRNDISNKFSLKEYATGALLRGTKRAGGGIW